MNTVFCRNTNEFAACCFCRLAEDETKRWFLVLKLPWIGFVLLTNVKKSEGLDRLWPAEAASYCMFNKRVPGVYCWTFNIVDKLLGQPKDVVKEIPGEPIEHVTLDDGQEVIVQTIEKYSKRPLGLNKDNHYRGRAIVCYKTEKGTELSWVPVRPGEKPQGAVFRIEQAIKAAVDELSSIEDDNHRAM